MGSFIFGYDLITNYRDHRFVHEYGHYLQSKGWGWFWLPIIGFPSLTSAITTDSYTHGDMWYERNANKLGGNYFDKYYGSGAEGYTYGDGNYFHIEYFHRGASAAKRPYGHPNTSTSPSSFQIERNRLHLGTPLIHGFSIFLFILPILNL
jgi:hypothetical protein